jgi:two-component system, NtrC family, sensor histidine kinase PilS
VLDNLLSGLATADAENRLVTFNRSAMLITGRDGALPIGERAADVLQLPPAFETTLSQDLVRVRSKRYDYRFGQPNGNEIEIGLSVAALPLPDGSRGYLYTFQDVTDIKRFEQSARLQQRLAAVGEMAAGIAHEIRNPLASMSGSMQMLKQELPLSNDQAQLMDIVLKESDRLNQTIRSFLAYARPQRFSMQKLDLRPIVQETAMLLRNSPEVKDAHTIDVHLADQPVHIHADESQIRQIIWNLATNGLRAMPEGGALRISAVHDQAGERHAVLRVEDEGVGIPPEDVDAIFQPFRGSFGKGSGLGLAIVHRIVTDYGGHIDVTSTVGRGTEFRVVFAESVDVSTRQAS